MATHEPNFLSRMEDLVDTLQRQANQSEDIRNRLLGAADGNGEGGSQIRPGGVYGRIDGLLDRMNVQVLRIERSLSDIYHKTPDPDAGPRPINDTDFIARQNVPRTGLDGQ